MRAPHQHGRHVSSTGLSLGIAPAEDGEALASWCREPASQ